MPINISQIRYDLTWITPDGGSLSLLPVLSTLTWEEQPGQLAMRCTFKVKDTMTSLGMLQELLVLGGHCVLSADVGQGWQQINQFVVFERAYDTAGIPSPTVTAYDSLVYMMKSDFHKLYLEDAKASQILEDLLAEFAVPIGRIDGPSKNVGARYAVHGSLGQSINDILRRAFVESEDESEYFMRLNAGKVEVVQPGQNPVMFHFSELLNVASMTDNVNINNLVTQVQIYSQRGQLWADLPEAIGPGETNEAPPPLKGFRQGPHPEFGRLVAVVEASQNDTVETLGTNADLVLAERGEPERVRHVLCPDHPLLRKGDMHVFQAGTLSGPQVVSGVVHTAESRSMDVMIDDSGTLARRIRRVTGIKRPMLSDEPGIQAGV